MPSAVNSQASIADTPKQQGKSQARDDKVGHQPEDVKSLQALDEQLDAALEQAEIAEAAANDALQQLQDANNNVADMALDQVLTDLEVATNTLSTAATGATAALDDAFDQLNVPDPVSQAVIDAAATSVSTAITTLETATTAAQVATAAATTAIDNLEQSANTLGDTATEQLAQEIGATVDTVDTALDGVEAATTQITPALGAFVALVDSPVRSIGRFLGRLFGFR